MHHLLLTMTFELALSGPMPPSSTQVYIPASDICRFSIFRLYPPISGSLTIENLSVWVSYISPPENSLNGSEDLGSSGFRYCHSTGSVKSVVQNSKTFSPSVLCIFSVGTLVSVPFVSEILFRISN